MATHLLIARLLRLLVLPTCVLFLVSPALATKKPPVHPININSANSEQLQEVPGIGPATAEKILQMRKSYGAFKSVDDLLAIRGIGPKRLEKMRKFLVAGKATGAVSGKTSGSPPGKPSSSKVPVPTKCSGCDAAAPGPAPAKLTKSVKPPTKTAEADAKKPDGEDE